MGSSTRSFFAFHGVRNIFLTPFEIAAGIPRVYGKVGHFPALPSRAGSNRVSTKPPRPNRRFLILDRLSAAMPLTHTSLIGTVSTLGRGC